MNGSALLTSSRPRMVVALTAATLVLPGLARAQDAARSVTDLGTLGGESTEVAHLNEAGTVTGMSQDGRAIRSARDLRGSYQAFVKPLDQPMVDLFDYNGVRPRLINDAGVVVGTRFSSSGQTYAAFRWRTGPEVEDLPAPAEGRFGWPADLDEAGNVLLTTSTKSYLLRASDGGFAELACFAGFTCEATAMNEAGVIVGVAQEEYDPAASSQRQRAVLWASATAQPVDLPGDPAHAARPVDVNNRGTIVGVRGDDENAQAVVWSGAEHALRELGDGAPSALNDHDYAVGKRVARGADFDAARPVLWDLRGDARTELPLSAKDGTGGVLHAINNAGMILGTTYDAAGHDRGVLYRGYAPPR